MSNETNKTPLPPTENSEEPSEASSEAPRRKTPLELVRERQAQMRGQQNTAKHGSSGADLSGPAESYKRRMRQRKSG